MFTLVLGGARSGKSRYAQQLCEGDEVVVYIATAEPLDDDPEMRERIARHRSSRPSRWRTIEAPLELEAAVESIDDGATILVDCVTVWLANLGWTYRDLSSTESEARILDRVARLAALARERRLVAVSNEVGSGIVPATPVGRDFRDVHGIANQLLAREADSVVLMVAGLAVPIKNR